eukprot:Skav230971  [mRNA]  locus=scaffold644:45652:48329:+ [translate_table: standard]
MPKETLRRREQKAAAFAVRSATSWFTKEQLDDIDTWLNEVAECGEAEDWIQHFPEDDLRDVVLDKLRRSDARSLYEVDVAKAITVEYVGGNFGTGRHDGSIYIDDEGLTIKDSRNPGMSMVWGGELPEDPEQLGKCLTGRNWDEHWEDH